MPHIHHDTRACSSQNTENRSLKVCHQEPGLRWPNCGVWHLEFFSAPLSDISIRSFAGATSGVASSVVTCPLDVVKTRLQGRGGLQLWTLDSISKRRSFKDRGLIGTGRAIWRERGLVGMYQGLGPTMLATLPRGAIYFTVYHKVNNSSGEIFGNLS